MKKVSSIYLKKIKPDDIIAQYTTGGDSADFYAKNDIENIDLYSVTEVRPNQIILKKLPVPGIEKIEYSVCKKPQELSNGQWWYKIDFAILCFKLYPPPTYIAENALKPNTSYE